jgi:uncharacterized membrane protein
MLLSDAFSFQISNFFLEQLQIMTKKAILKNYSLLLNILGA